MKISPFLLTAAAVVAAVYLLKKSGTSQSPAAQAPEAVVNMVEETLHRHEGEDTPVVHAFEEAVAHTHQGA
jgi:hypothetical protein